MLQTLKLRDGELPPPLHLVRRRVELAEMVDRADMRRGPVTSCVIVADSRTREDREAERHAALDAESHAVDLRVLRAMRDHPEATNIRKLRARLGSRLDEVNEAVSRLLRTGFVTEGKRGQPYVLTAAGRAALDEAAS